MIPRFPWGNQVAIKGNYMRKLVLKNLGLSSVEHKVVVLSTKN